MSTDWPPLSDFPATVGRLATPEDTRANRASFILQSEGQRIGSPLEMPLPRHAWFVDRDTGNRQRCVILQAEEADQKVYFGGWLIDEKRQIVGFDTDFEILEP